MTLRRHLDLTPASGHIYRVLIDPLLAPLRTAVVKAARPTAGLRVLDIGCGTGAQLRLLLGDDRVLVGLDESPPMVGQARRLVGDAAAVCLGDGTELPFEDGAFDLVVISMVLHASAPAVRARLMSEARRVVREEGSLVVVDYMAPPPSARARALMRLIVHPIERAVGQEHYRAYRQFMGTAGVEALVQQAGLSVTEVRPWGQGLIGIYLCAPVRGG